MNACFAVVAFTRKKKIIKHTQTHCLHVNTYYTRERVIKVERRARCEPQITRQTRTKMYTQNYRSKHMFKLNLWKNLFQTNNSKKSIVR